MTCACGFNLSSSCEKCVFGHFAVVAVVATGGFGRSSAPVCSFSTASAPYSYLFSTPPIGSSALLNSSSASPYPWPRPTLVWHKSASSSLPCQSLFCVPIQRLFGTVIHPPPPLIPFSISLASSKQFLVSVPLPLVVPCEQCYRVIENLSLDDHTEPVLGEFIGQLRPYFDRSCSMMSPKTGSVGPTKERFPTIPQHRSNRKPPSKAES